MDLDLMKLGRDVKQSLTLEHVRWFMYQVGACHPHVRMWLLSSSVAALAPFCSRS
jgi:hypothetical protein